MSQSDVARAVWGTTTDKRGYTVARNRDRVSAYEAGKAFPEADNLMKLADLFGVDVKELAPEHVASGAAGARAKPAVNLTVVDASQGLAHLTVDVVVSFELAAQVVRLLSEGGAQSQVPDAG